MKIMTIMSILFTLLAIVPSLHAAAFSSSEMPVSGVHTLISADNQSIEIPVRVAIKYSGLLKQLEDFSTTQSELRLGSLAGSATDLSTAHFSGQTLSLLAQLMEKTEFLEDDPLLKDSTMQRAEKVDIDFPKDIDIFQELFRAAEYLQVSSSIIDVIAYKAVRLFSNTQLLSFLAHDISKNPVAKQLSFKDRIIPAIWKRGTNGITFSLSIQDLIDYDKLPAVRHARFLYLKNLHINDLTGINRLPDAYYDVTDLILNNNELCVINSGLFNRFTKLRLLDLGNNRIEKLNAHMFQSLNMLNMLLLGGNIISSIDRDAFAGLDNLDDLALSNNPISTIPEGTFSCLKKLGFLFLKKTHLDREEKVRVKIEFQAISSSSDGLRCVWFS